MYGKHGVERWDNMALEMSGLFGRKEIFTDVKEINRDNIVSVLTDALNIHRINKTQIEYLKNYVRGDQPILSRIKEVRPEINFKIVENHAAEIVSFKTGYVFGSPISLVQRGKVDAKESDELQDDKRISILNEMLFEEDKHAKDRELGEEMSICGIGHRIILPRPENDIIGTSPFYLLNLPSENTFVVKSNDIYRKPVLGVTFTENTKDKSFTYGAYTDKYYFTLEGNLLGNGLKLINTELNLLGMIPIVEYPNNSARQGSFEPVIPLLDALNIATSDRLNGIAQFVQALMWFNNCQIDSNQYSELKAEGAILTKSEPGLPANVEYITETLNQSETQTLVDYMYDCILQIAGVPDRKVSTGGNTGQAIQLSNGWETAEAMARSTELLFSQSEKASLRIIIKILNTIKTVDINDIALSDIDIKFSRSKNDNASIKIQNLIGQLNAGIHPRIAIANCGLFSDAEQTYIDSLPYLKKWENIEPPEEKEEVV